MPCPPSLVYLAFFIYLLYLPINNNNHANHPLENLVLAKVRIIAWLVPKKKVNTCDVLLVKRHYKALKRVWCVMYKESKRISDSSFSTLSTRIGVVTWRLAEVDWDPRSMEEMLIILFRSRKYDIMKIDGLELPYMYVDPSNRK